MTNRAELKATYKQNWHKLRKIGVYQIKNRVNGKVYLGSSTNLDGTLSRDLTWLTRGGFLNHELQAEWNAFGAEAFGFEILETLTPTDDPRDYTGELALLLEVWFEQLQPFGDNGYHPTPRR